MNILVTGGTSGIGKSTVELLSLSGHNVVFVGRNQERGAEVEQISGATFIAADISKPQECERVTNEYFSIFDTCDVLINNAGLWTEGKLETIDVEEIEKVLIINTLSPIVLTRYMLPKMKKAIEDKQQTSARIIFINSQAGLIAKAQRATYNASKWAITGFARSLALEVAQDNIGITNFCPGYIATELFDHAGYPRDTTGAIEPTDIAETIKYILDMPQNISINEIGIKPTTYA